MDSKTQNALETVNKKLSRIKIRLKGNKLYLRGTFPPRRNDGILPKQYELATSLSFTPEGVKIAFARAQEIESRLNLEKFNWADYLENGELGTKTINRWTEEFETHYWLTRERTPNRELTYKHAYTYFFQELPQDEPLSESVIIPVITQYASTTSVRHKAYLAYNALLNFANIKHDLKQYNVRYKTKIERDLPSDEEIVRIVESVPESWRWTFGILATYGLRGHEIKLLDCSKTEDPPHIVYVHSDTKSGSRPVYPVPPQWVNRWKLWEVNKPNIAIGHDTNQIYGRRLCNLFVYYATRYAETKISQYYFRDAYAVRCSLMGVDAAIAAKWMGHSLQIHSQEYLKFFNEVHHKQAWERMLRNNE